MKTIFFLLFSVTIIRAEASNYYFSNAYGEDSRTPMQAKNPATPWKSLDKLNSFFMNLSPGDSVLLKRGETFYGSIKINKSGTANAPIVIGAYGKGDKPVITGLVALSFTAVKNNIYESQPLTPAVINIVTVNGSLKAMGRFPNTGYLSFESHEGKTSLTDSELAATPNWAGAELVLRSRRWIIDRNTVVSQSGNTLVYKTASIYEPRDKYGYFLQNSPLTLDAPGEWYYDPSTKKISLFSLSAPKNVNASTIDDLISTTGSSNVTIANVAVEGANKNGINIVSGSNIHLIHCDISLSGEDGVKVTKHSGFQLDNSTVANSLNNGVELSTNASYSRITNNLVQNTSMLPGMGVSGDKKGIGIYSAGSNNLIAYNRVINSGYSGIHFGGDSAVIQNNFVDSFCCVKDDGGGIYTYVGGGAARKGRKIIGNIVLDGIGASAGTDNPRQLEATGIYLDDNTTDIEIRDNTVARCNNQGIFLQNTSGVVIANNSFYDNHQQFALIQKPNKLVRNNIFQNNIFFSKSPAQQMAFLASAANDADQFGSFINNYYVKPINNKLVIVNNQAGGAGANAEIKDWNEKYGKDENSKGMAKTAAMTFNPNYVVRFEYNASRVNKTISLDGNYADPKNNKFSNSLVLQPYTSAILIKQK